MATATRGCLGVVKVQDLAATGAIAAVGGLAEWSLNEEAESIDASEIGTCTKSSIAGANQRSGSLSGFWDTSGGANQNDLTVGNIIAFEIYPGGSGSGNTYYETTTGGATITSVERGGGVDGTVSLSVSFEINGDMTTSTVP
jgi:predicted secreted protein